MNRDQIHIDRGIDGVLSHWLSGGIAGEFTAHVTTGPVSARQGKWPQWLDLHLLQALSAMGVREPYSHQVDAWNAIAAGRHTVIATPTASGKTLCYNVPVMQRLIQDPHARALYLFPTKALARDQEAAIRKLVALCGVDIKAVVYDGDTPADSRRTARRDARIIITNPDMLHTGILPHHAGWSHFFAGLSHVVVDELHGYRGVFGSHVANVLRRLVRVAQFHGASPIFTGCSATIGNPAELGQAVLGVPVELINDTGAPAGQRTFLVHNPPVVDAVLGTRLSTNRMAARMAADLVRGGVVTLVFCQTRRGTEIVLRYLREKLKRDGRDPQRIRGYRGGYLPTLRREIEGALRGGEVDAVVATNALELGIDVGELDAVVLAGYPGTIAATHQRSGRAGRRRAPSLSVLIARSTPLDQFLAREPSFLIESSPETALVQPDNVEILLDHLRCAAFELPFDRGVGWGSLSGEDTDAALDCLVAEKSLIEKGNRYHFIGSDYPAAKVSLRDIGGEPVVVIDANTDEPIAEVGARSARFELFERAIYQHEGDIYEVEHFSPEEAKARVRAVPPVYYTTAVEQCRVSPLQERETMEIRGGRVMKGDLEVVENVIGFKKIKFRTHENLGYGDVKLPPLQMETEGMWLHIHPDVTRTWKPDVAKVALEGLAHAFHQVAALRLMTDPRDIAVVVQSAEDQKETPEEPSLWHPALYLYDTHAGGVGLSEGAFTLVQQLFLDAHRLITGCACLEGCPSCIGPPPMAPSFPFKSIAREIAAWLGGIDDE